MSAASDQQGPEGPESSANRLRAVVAVLVGVEAVLLLAGAVGLVLSAVTADQGGPAAAIAMAVLAAGVGAGLAVCVRGILRGLRWTRGPVLTWQLLQAGVAMPVSTTAAWWVGVPLLAMSIVVGVLIAGRHVITETSDRY